MKNITEPEIKLLEELLNKLTATLGQEYAIIPSELFDGMTIITYRDGTMEQSVSGTTLEYTINQLIKK